MSSHTYTIDRFEDNGWAVLEREDGETFNIPADWLPEDAQDSHVLTLELDTQGKESRLRFVLDDEKTARRREDAKARWEGLPKGPEGDIEL